MFMSLARVVTHCFFPFLDSKPLRVWLSVYHQSKEALMAMSDLSSSYHNSTVFSGFAPRFLSTRERRHIVFRGRVNPTNPTLEWSSTSPGPLILSAWFSVHSSLFWMGEWLLLGMSNYKLVSLFFGKIISLKDKAKNVCPSSVHFCSKMSIFTVFPPFKFRKVPLRVTHLRCYSQQSKCKPIAHIVR